MPMKLFGRQRKLYKADRIEVSEVLTLDSTLVADGKTVNYRRGIRRSTRAKDSPY